MLHHEIAGRPDPPQQRPTLGRPGGKLLPGLARQGVGGLLQRLLGTQRQGFECGR
jgi:hypothetical protein